MSDTPSSEPQLKTFVTRNFVKIAITGGPSGGKTTLIETLKREYGSEVAIVPESASILYKGGFPRFRTHSAIRHAQVAIYSTQKELEQLLIEHNPEAHLIVCDRGSLDGIAYWPEDDSHELNFLKTINSSHATECSRYDWVIHLDTATQSHYETTNPIRTESHFEAMALNQRIKKAWEGHPRRLIIGSQSDFLGKMHLSIQVIQAIRKNKTLTQILESFHDLKLS